MGVSAYTCFAMVGMYMIFTVAVFIRRWHYIERNKRVSILTYLIGMGLITTIQALNSEML